MERPLKNRVSSILALLTACQLGLGLAYAEGNADGKPDVAPASSNSAVADTALTLDALRQRGANLDNFIYEASDAASASGGKDSHPTESEWLRPQILWIAAGAACLIGIGTAYLLSGSGDKKVTYTDYGY